LANRECGGASLRTQLARTVMGEVRYRRIDHGNFGIGAAPTLPVSADRRSAFPSRHSHRPIL
jgi:hypothetical protein